jgi:predicted GIY-YIG superfamily endonuclease
MANKTSLVCEYLEKISSKALEDHQDIIRSYVGERHGVYALYDDKGLYYVGLAQNLKTRLQHHLKDKHKKLWSRFSVYLTISDSHMKELESLLLRVVSTSGNKQKGKFICAENLGKRFKADMHKKMNKEVDSFFEAKRPRITPPPVKQKRTSTRATAGKEPTLADYVTKPFTIKKTFKGDTFIAKVQKDGTIKFNGEVYTSPSFAAKAADKDHHTKNGWRFWKYENERGKWVKLDELRK